MTENMKKKLLASANFSKLSRGSLPPNPVERGEGEVIKILIKTLSLVEKNNNN